MKGPPDGLHITNSPVAVIFVFFQECMKSESVKPKSLDNKCESTQFNAIQLIIINSSCGHKTKFDFMEGRLYQHHILEYCFVATLLETWKTSRPQPVSSSPSMLNSLTASSKLQTELSKVVEFYASTLLQCHFCGSQVSFKIKSSLIIIFEDVYLVYGGWGCLFVANFKF